MGPGKGMLLLKPDLRVFGKKLFVKLFKVGRLLARPDPLLRWPSLARDLDYNSAPLFWYDGVTTGP
jgi:hypothetical protein